MNEKEMLRFKTEIIKAGALMRQADFCKCGVSSEVISFMVESAVLRANTKADKPKEKRLAHLKDRCEMSTVKCRVLKFERKENENGI